MTKDQVWFKTDLEYLRTREKLRKSERIFGDFRASKGRLTFYFIEFKDYSFQITTKGKVSITYPDTVDYKEAWGELQPFLVKADGSPVAILEITENIQKKLKKLEAEKPSKLNLLAYLKWKKIYEDDQLKKIIRRLEAEDAIETKKNEVIRP